MNYAPICLFVFNRIEHTKKTIEFLKNNLLANESDLLIFSDGPRNELENEKIKALRSYLKSINGFKTVEIFNRDENWGLARSIIEGVSTVLNRFDRVIVLEDDMITSPYFLNYMNDGLNTYQHDENVASIHGYTYPVASELEDTFFLKGADCWGWATWKSRWAQFEPNGEKLLRKLIERGLVNEFNFNNSYPYTDMLKKQILGKNNSWAIRWYASAFLKDMYTLYPGKSLVQNIGNDDSGTHCSTTNEFEVQLAHEPIKVQKIPIERNDFAFNAFSQYFNDLKGNRYKRALKKILNYLQINI